jgi:hypothetical protein
LDVLGDKLTGNAKFQATGKGNISFNAGTDSKKVVACVVEIDKN